MVFTKGNVSLRLRIQLGLIKSFWVNSRSSNLYEYKEIDPEVSDLAFTNFGWIYQYLLVCCDSDCIRAD